MRLWAIACVVVTLSRSVGAGEPEDRSRAQTLRAEGDRLSKKGKWKEAAAQYSASHMAFPEPETALSLARAERKLGRLAEVANAYAAFLRISEASAKGRKEAQAELDKLDLKLGRLKFAGPAGFLVKIDGATVGRLPLDPHRVTPGPHAVTFESPDTVSLTKRVYVGKQLQVTVEVEVEGS